jgi:signal transduction histidine kinase
MTGYMAGDSDLHLALVLVEGMIGLLAGYLALGRLRRWRRMDQMLLGSGLALLGVTNLLFAALPAVVSDEEVDFTVWAAATGRLSASLLLAAAALVSRRRLRLTGRQIFFGALALADLVLLIGVTTLVFRDALPAAVVDGALHPAFAAILLIGAAAHTVAAVGFGVRARQTHDGLLGALALACALGTAALVIYLTNPVTISQTVGLSDLLRLGFYLAVLLVVVREMEEQARSSLARAALEERRRVARDIHDGLAQELASIQRNLAWLDEDDPFVIRASESAARGLAAARQAIDVLGDTPERDFAEVLAERVVIAAEREGASLSLNLDPKVTVGPAEREALVRIASEAVTNAARHGGADVVRVELMNRPRVRLRVTDAGSGFNPGLTAWAGGRGFGLADMHDRAQEIGARYRLKSVPGSGTEVEVVL